MPARFAGLLNSSPGTLSTADHTAWGACFPVAPPWTRVDHQGRLVTIFVDTCGKTESRQALAIADDGALGIAGAIRLDDRHDLSQELGQPQFEASEASDIGLVLRAYRRWGTDAFSRLRGDFAFALWDERAGAAHLVRDVFGVRRLYYATLGEGVVFSTDVEGVLAYPGVDRRPDDVTILDNLLGRYQTRERTFFHAVKRVLPGHFLRVRPAELNDVSYATPPRPSFFFSSLSEYGEAFRHALVRSVKDRLPHSSRVVCQVSGGLDSASVACLSSAALSASGRPDALVLATARFPGMDSDEGALVHELARALGIPVREWDGRRPELSDLETPRRAWPFGRSSVAGAHQGDLDIARATEADILLSGFGGNQVAYETGFLKDSWREGQVGGFLLDLRRIVTSRPWRWESRHLRRTLIGARGVVREALFRRNGCPARDVLDGPPPSWLGPRLLRAWTELRSEQPTASEPSEPRTGSWMTDAIWNEMANSPTNFWALEHEDARTSEQGLEIRYPYLSWSLLSVVMSIPWRLRPPTEHDRTLQRLALVGVIPERIRKRNTFVAFNESIMRNSQKAAPAIEGLLSGRRWMAEGLVNQRVADADFRRLANRLHEGFTMALAEEWRLIRDFAALEAWLRQV